MFRESGRADVRSPSLRSTQNSLPLGVAEDRPAGPIGMSPIIDQRGAQLQQPGDRRNRH